MAIRLLFGLTLTLVAASVCVPAFRNLLGYRSTLRILCGALVATRLMGWFGAYVFVEGLVQGSDLIIYYWDEATQATAGQIPYRDFASSYGPLFPYIAGVLLPFWKHPAAIALVMVATEIIAVLMFVQYTRKFNEGSSEVNNLWLWIYVINPSALYWSGVTAYNSSLVLVFWVIVIILLAADRYTLSLLSLYLSVLAGKVLAALVAPLLAAHPARRGWGIIGMLVVIAGSWWVGRSLGIDLMLPAFREGGSSTSGNLWFLLSGILPFAENGALWHLGPPLVLIGVILWYASVCHQRWKNAHPSIMQLCSAFATVGWLFMVLSRKTLPHYLPMFLMFAIYALSHGARGRAWIFVIMILGAVGIVEPVLWNELGQPIFLPVEELRETPWTVLALIGADLFLVGSSIFLLVQTLPLAFCDGEAKSQAWS